MKGLRFFLLALLLLVSVKAAAGDKITLTGKVTNVHGEPVVQATVAMENSSYWTLTGKDGRYTLKTPAGKQTLIVSATGYNTVRQAVALVRSAAFDFTLEENSALLDAVRIYGQSNAQRIRENVFAAVNVDVQRIAGVLNNLTTLVNRTSGIRIREEGGVGSDFNLSINGLSGNAVRYFIDGVPLSALGSGITLANLPVNLVERIEVYKGVVPATLGQDALGGAINIITRRNKGNYTDASIGGGSFHTAKTDFNAQYRFRKSGFTLRPSLGLNYSKNDYLMRDVEVWDAQAHEYRLADKRRFHDAYRSGFARLEAGFTDKPWADEAFISVALSAEKKELQTGRKQSIVIGNAVREKAAQSIAGRYTKENFLTPGLGIRLFLSYTADHTAVTDTTYRLYAWDGTWMATVFSEVRGREKSIRHYLRPQTTGRAYLHYKMDENRLLHLNYLFQGVGNRRYDDFDSSFVPTQDKMDKHTLGFSYNRLFLQGRLNGTLFVKDYIFHAELHQADLAWITGYESTAPKATRNRMGWGAGGRYTVLPECSVKISYERSVRLPVSTEFLGNGQTVYPNFKLKPEQSHNVNVGVFGDRASGYKHRLSYEVNFFMRKVQDYILRIPEGDRQSQYQNVASATVLGGEGDFAYEYDNMFRIAVNGSVLDERNKTRYNTNGKANVTYNNRMPNRPWLYANLLLTLNRENPFGIRGGRIRFDYGFQYIHWFFLTWEAFGSIQSKEIIPSQYCHNATLSWSFAHDRYTLSLECINVLNSKLYDNYMLQKPGRTFFGKLRIFIN